MGSYDEKVVYKFNKLKLLLKVRVFNALTWKLITEFEHKASLSDIPDLVIILSYYSKYFNKARI